MTLSQDELRTVIKKFNRAIIDAGQGMNYSLDSKYADADVNFDKAIQALQEIKVEIKD